MVRCCGNSDSPRTMPETANMPQASEVFGLSLAGDCEVPCREFPTGPPCPNSPPQAAAVGNRPWCYQWLCTWAVRESWFPAVFLVNCGKRDLNLHGRCDSRKMKLCFPASSLALQNSLASLSSKHEEKKTCNMNSHAHRAKDHAIFTVKFEDELLFEIPSV